MAASTKKRSKGQIRVKSSNKSQTARTRPTHESETDDGNASDASALTPLPEEITPPEDDVPPSNEPTTSSDSVESQPATHSNVTPAISTDANGTEHASHAPDSTMNEENGDTNGFSSHQLIQNQTSYQNFLREFLLSPTSEQPSATTATPDENIIIAASLFTPIGSRLTYYSNPANWSLFRPKERNPTQILIEDDIVQTLYLNTSYANKRSVMLLEDPRYFQAQIKKMFLTAPDSKHADYHHIQLQLALLDRFVWSRLPMNTNIHRLPSRAKPSNLPESVQSLFKSCREWQSTLATAASNFLVYEDVSNDTKVTEKTKLQGPDNAVISLGTRLAQSKNGVAVNHIEQNFIAAAIALRGVAEVNTYNSIS